MSALDAMFGKRARGTLFSPIITNNPIAVQVLGICSALAVTTRIDKALVMGAGVTLVTAFANLAVSLVRNYTPSSISPFGRYQPPSLTTGSTVKPNTLPAPLNSRMNATSSSTSA